MVTVRNQGQAIICRLEFTHPIRWGGNRTQIRTEGRIRPPAARHISSQSYYWRNSRARRELRAHLGLLGRHRWQCRSSSIGFLGVDFAPPHVKNGRLAFPRAARYPFHASTRHPVRLSARSWHFEWRRASVRRMRMGRRLLHRSASTKSKSPSKGLRPVMKAFSLVDRRLSRVLLWTAFTGPQRKPT
jgi:hypothetical protein